MKTDILIIGGGPAGVVTALTARGSYPDKDITLVRREEMAVIPCAIPYIFGTLGDVEKNRLPDRPLKDSGVELLIDEVLDIDLEGRVAKTREGLEIGFEKLVLATGSKPSIPPIEGRDLEGVFPIYKDARHLRSMLEWARESDEIVVIGGGFIGVELADELLKAGKTVSIIEILPHILSLSFDDEFCQMVEEELRRRGLSLYTGVAVKRILGEKRVEAVELEGGETLKADMVVVATGARPNTELAERIGLDVSRYGVVVDEYMRTSHPDVFAVGDCAEKRDFFTQKPGRVMLASVATAEARIAGANLYRLTAFRRFRGTLGIFSTRIGDLALGVAGLIERRAEGEGFDYVVGRSKVFDKHPASLPGSHEVHVKLIFTRRGGFFLGGQIAGGESVGEMINIIGLAIECGMTAAAYANLQIGTHPLLTPPPTAPATIKAAEDALKQISA